MRRDRKKLALLDGDFRPLVEALQGRGIHVTVVSTVESQPPIVADELRRQVDAFIDLMELRPKISREQRPPDHGVIQPQRLPLRPSVGWRSGAKIF
jgi:uncharacterized LabA/DUF88 family protein